MYPVRVGRHIVFPLASICSPKLVVMWLSISPFDPYVANSDVYFWALGGTRKPLNKKSLKMFEHLGQVSTLNLDVHHWPTLATEN